MEKIYKSILCCIGICFIFLGLIVVVGTFSDNSNVLPTDNPIQINNETFYLDNCVKIEEQNETGCLWRYDNMINQKGSLRILPQNSVGEYITNYTYEIYEGKYKSNVTNTKKNNMIIHNNDLDSFETYNDYYHKSYSILFYRNDTLYVFEVIVASEDNKEKSQEYITSFINNNNITEFYNL